MRQILVVGFLIVAPTFGQQKLTDTAPSPGGFVPSQPEAVNGTVTFYSDRGTFESENPGLPLEDFETPLHPPGSGVLLGCPEPADSNGSTGCYAPGDLLSGFSMTSPGAGTPGQELVILDGAAGFGSPPGIVLGSNTFAASTRVDFNPPVTAVGMDIVTLLAGNPVTVSLFDGGGVLIDSQTGVPAGAGGSFWGAASATPIAFLTIEDTTLADVELLDDMEFGTAVPVELQTFDVE